VADPTVPGADIRVDARLTSAPGAGPATGSSAASNSDGELAPLLATAVFALPLSRAPRAVLRATDPDGRVRDFGIEASDLTIGRAADNDLVARDVRVSRHHGRIVGRHGTLVYVDLGSTNGSRVNGEAVTEVVLGVGDRLEIGDTVLILEEGAAPA
jgi:hypothetical protein